LPELNTEDDTTIIYEGVKGIEVQMIDYPKNPYRLIYEFATATWGPEDYPENWPETSPENRFYVVRNAIRGKALPLGLEAIKFSFIVRKASRSAFDQHARQRLATFASQGVRDNSRLAAGFRCPDEIYNDPGLLSDVKEYLKLYKLLYKKILQRGIGSFQTARSLMPMGMTHSYKFAVDYLAMKSYMAQRLSAVEQSDTVATAILVWDQVNKKFPLLANELRPRCDFAGKCICHQGDGSELFGALFKGCGRFPTSESNYYTFNRSSSDYNTLEKQTGVHLPWPNEWKNYDKFEELEDKDKLLFNE
jgi:thymidylate synthase ThyX